MEIELNVRRVVVKIILDIACILLVGAPILMSWFLLTPYRRGFFCDDLSLRHPYKSSTVTELPLNSLGIGFPLLTIIIVELIIYFFDSDKLKFRMGKMVVPGWVVEIYIMAGFYIFGLACTQFLTAVAKTTIGRLRPHFIDVCKPKINCSDEQFRYAYIEKFECAGTKKRRIEDARRSFPSGHSSMSSYAMVYLILYLQAKMTWSVSTLLKHFIQLICFALALFVCLSRISDYKHHWSDVLVGAIVGSSAAVLVAVYAAPIFVSEERDESESAEDTGK